MKKMNRRIYFMICECLCLIKYHLSSLTLNIHHCVITLQNRQHVENKSYSFPFGTFHLFPGEENDSENNLENSKSFTHTYFKIFICLKYAKLLFIIYILLLLRDKESFFEHYVVIKIKPIKARSAL